MNFKILLVLTSAFLYYAEVDLLFTELFLTKIIDETFYIHLQIKEFQ